ncbi:MAG: hypothetical protein QW456_10155 [Ignisphaera sp.]
MNLKYISSIVKVFTATTIILFIIFINCLNHEVYVYAEFVEPRDRVFGYSIDLASIGIAPKYVDLIDRSRAVVTGAIGNVYGVTVLDLSNPYRDPIVEDIYPLTGSPTCVAKDGFPITRIAVGSDRGEILIFRVDRGRITRHLYIVLGSDFYVNKVFLAKDSEGNVKILALVSEGGPRTSPCINCHLYILDEEAQGILRIGPKVGNATVLGRVYEGIYVQDVAPLTIYSDSGFYWDASNVLLAYIPQKNIVRLVFNITYLYNGTPLPAPKTLIEVNITVKGLTSVIYGINADDRGVARVPVQIDPTRPTYISLSIRNIVGEIVWKYDFVYDPARYRITPEEIPIPTAILQTQYVDTRPAEKVYGVPGFLRINLMLIDITPAPFSITERGSATFLIDPPIHGFFFIRGAKEERPKVVYGTSGYVYITTVAIEPNRIRNIVTVEDYVGAGATSINEAGTYSDGSYILLGLSDGRLRIYVPQAGGGYRLRYVYPLPSATRSIITIPMGLGYTYVAVSESGIQILRSSPYPQPIFRKSLHLHASTQRYVDGDALPDLSTMVLLDSSSIFVVRNTYIAVDRQISLSIDDIMARDITVNIVMPGNESTADVLAIFRYPRGSVEYRLNGNTSLTLKNVIQGIEYALEIYTARPYIYNSSIKFMLREDMTIDVIEKEYLDVPLRPRCCSLDIGLKYREYSVTLKIMDNLEATKLVAPIDIYIDGIILKENTYETVHTSKLLYGVHQVMVKPSKGFEDAYAVAILEVQIDRDAEIHIVLQRKVYNVVIRVIDEITGLNPIVPINMTVFNTSYMISPEKYIINITLPYGTYKASFNPCEGYERAYGMKKIEIDVPRTKIYTIVMSRNVYSIDILLSDVYSGVLVAPVDLYLNDTLIVSNVSGPKISYTIPYGNWMLRVAPSKGYEHVYEVYDVELNVDRDMVQEVKVLRVQYTITIDVVDIYGKLVSPMTVTVKGPTTIEYSIEPPGRTLYLLLPYGIYSINVEPMNKSIYIPYITTIEIRSSQNIKIPIQRVRYRLEIIAEDRYIGVVVGRFDVYVNGTKIVDNMAIRTVVDIPYGVYVIQLIPSGVWDKGYSPSKPVIVNVIGNTSVKIPVERRIYTLKIVVIEGVNPIRNAVATIYSEETLAVVTQLISDANGIIETKLPYGSYRIVITHPDYNIAEIPYISLDVDRSELVTMTPTLVALLWRYMPVIVTLIGLGIAIYVIMKVKAILAKRLVPEEELF